MKKFISFIVFVLLFPLVVQALEFTSQEKEFINKNPRAKVALMPDFSPFSFLQNSRVVGFENDLLQIISQKTGLEFDREFDVWNKNLKAFKTKKVDMIASISHKKEREAFTLFTTPYYKIPIMIFVRDDFGKYEGIQSLEGKKVGILKDVFYAKELKKYIDNELYITETYDELTEALVFGKIDALIQNLPNINYLIKKNLYTNLVLADELQLPGIKKEDLRFGINPDKPLLYSIVQKALDSIDDAQWKSLSDSWLSVKLMDNDFKEQTSKTLTILSEEEKAYLKNNTITIGMINDYYPFSYVENGKISGFSYEYFKLLASKVDMKFEIEIDNWSPSLTKFKNKKLDIIDAISYTKKREKFTNFSNAYFHIPNVIFARKEDFQNYKGLESLRGKRVGITEKIYYFDTIKNLDLCELVVFKSSREKIKALALGKIDAAFNNLTSGQKYIVQNGYTNIRVLDELDDAIVKKEDLRLGVSKDNLMLDSIVKKAMSAITSYEKRKLINKYFGVDFQKKYDKKDIEFNEKEKRYLEEKQEFKMCTLPDALPLEHIDKNDKHKGIAGDIIQIVSQKINKPIVLVPTSDWSKSLENIKNRECDILPAAMYTFKRQKQMNFTDPYLVETLVVVTKNDKFFIEDSSGLKNHKIGAVKGYGFIDTLQQKHPEIDVVYVKSAKEGLQRVEDGELFGYVDILPSIAYTMQTEGLLDLKVAGKLEFNIELSMASRKDEPLLNSILQKALNDIGDEKIRSIVGKWVSIKVEESFDYRKLIYISLFFLAVLSVVLYKNRSIKALNKKLSDLSITDNLTQLFNRNKLDEVLKIEADRSNRFRRSFAVILMDIDYFKSVNDTHGHQMGDTVLKEFARILKSSLRKTDTVGRWGGEEFMVICSETDLEGANSLAENIREKVASFTFSLGEQKTASFGVSMYKKDEDIQELIKRADEALYKAKENGRDRVEIM